MENLHVMILASFTVGVTFGSIVTLVYRNFTLEALRYENAIYKNHIRNIGIEEPPPLDRYDPLAKQIEQQEQEYRESQAERQPIPFNSVHRN